MVNVLQTQLLHVAHFHTCLEGCVYEDMNVLWFLLKSHGSHVLRKVSHQMCWSVISSMFGAFDWPVPAEKAFNGHLNQSGLVMRSVDKHLPLFSNVWQLITEQDRKTKQETGVKTPDFREMI